MTLLPTTKHPFVVAIVLYPAMKFMSDFPDELWAAVYDYVRSLVSAANVESTVVEEVQKPPTKRAREDVRSATMSFLAHRIDTIQASLTTEFDRYLNVALTLECEPLAWWKKHQDVFLSCVDIP